MVEKKSSDMRGLTNQEVLERVKNGLNNKQKNDTTKSVRQIIKSNVITLFNFINVILAICILCVGSYQNALFMGVIFCNVCIGIYQEVKAKRVIDRLALISAPRAKVLRDNEKVEILMEEVVMDDLLLLNAGDQICVDAVIEHGMCEVNESLLTGESDPVVKVKGDELFSGSFVISGDVMAKTIRVGKDSYANEIVGGVKYIKPPNSQIMKSITFLIKVITCCIIPIGTILFCKQYYIVKLPMDRVIVSTVAAIIGMIPEGLVLLTSMVLAISATRLAKKMVLVQDMYCIETLARVDVLCLDKTGTITEGAMQLDEIVPLHKRKQELEKILNEMMGILNDGNPTFLAIKEAYQGTTTWDCIERIPFSSVKKWSLVSYKKQGTFILGAAEYILGHAVHTVSKQMNEYAKKGQRVLLLAHADKRGEKGKLPDEITPIGFIILSDKIKTEAPDTIKYFKEQGVAIKIISGDNALTVANVAQRVGVKNAMNYIDMTHIKTDEEIEEAVKKYEVFGRVTPHQKLKLIKALQKKGHTVAMTGDGVNDVLALKEADCSIAMQSGSDAARSVSQLVLLNSNFSCMPQIVAEGRKTINNLQRSASLFLVKTTYAFLLGFIFAILNHAYPFAPIQLTLISSLTIGIPSFLLALEPNYNRVEGHFLKNVLKKAIPGGLLVVTNTLFMVLLFQFVPATVEQIGTVATFTTAAAHMVVLYKVCMPFNTMRTILYGGIIGAFFGAIFIFHSLFLIVYLKPVMWILIGVLVLISGKIHDYYTTLVDFMMEKGKGRING